MKKEKVGQRKKKEQVGEDVYRITVEREVWVSVQSCTGGSMMASQGRAAGQVRSPAGSKQLHC
jgi:hypothetical protein